MSELATMVGGRVRGEDDPMLTDVTHDSRAAHSGMLYVAIPGARVDGHDFVRSAVDAGAEAVCVQHPTGATVPEMIVDDTRAALGRLAAAVHDHPSRSVDVVGVTGTNGKTTVTHYIESLARRQGKVTGLAGTIHSMIAGVEIPASMTTPEGSDFQRLLAEMRDRGVEVAAVEVSSHALAFGRVNGTRFAVGAFTNLSQDHLDFHGDMASYRAAKESLFSDYEVGAAVINVDDPVGAEIATRFQGTLVTVGERGEVRADDLTPVGAGTRFSLTTPWGTARVTAPVYGDFNVHNLTMAAACCVAVGLPFDGVVGGMASVEGVPGRFEIVSGDDPITVIVDYAHTPEGVRRAVQTARTMARGRVIGLIGAGGDRDREKRPAMGAAVSGSDLAVITSDNPRTEDPAEIVASVAKGLTGPVGRVIEVDRRLAIEAAIAAADDGDVVLILGRGHEPFQDLGTEKVPFDDRHVAMAALRRRRKSADSGEESGSITT